MRIALAALVLMLAVVPATATSAPKPPPWTDNCTKFNKRYPNGVGKVGAKDKRKSGPPAVLFKRSNIIYATAMKWNDDLDRDGDKIACEVK
jgi:hypothetical protein